MSTMTDHTFDIPRGRAATVAGIGYLVILLFFPIGNTLLQNLVEPGDALASLINIGGDELSFQTAIASWIIVAVADMVVAWALYLYLEPVNRAYSMLTAWFRLVFVAIVTASLVNLLSILPVVGTTGLGQNDAALAALSLAPQEFGFYVAYVFFGLHILGLGYLVLKSNHIPKVLGIFLVIASAGYLIDSFASVLSADYAGNEAFFMILVGIPAVIAEYSLALWLLIRGRKTEPVERSSRVRVPSRS